MFGRNKDKKLDPRVRFQRTTFTRKLSEARNYKRTVKQKPESTFAAGLEKIGLARLLTQLAVAAFLIVIVYLVYVPNPLFVSAVRINGVSSESAKQAEQAVNDFFADQKWYFPGHNLLFVKPDAIADVLKAKVPSIWKVDSAVKSLRSHTVTITVTEKYERYALIRNDDELIIYNDGTVKSQQSKPDVLPQSGALVTVVVKTDPTVMMQQAAVASEYLNPELISFIEQVATVFPEKTGQSLAYFEISLVSDADKPVTIDPAVDPEVITEDDISTDVINPVTTPTISAQPLAQSWKAASIMVVVNKTGAQLPAKATQLRLVLEPGIDSNAAAERLKALLAQTTPDRYKNLYYIDLRLENRAFLCLLNTPCVSSAQ